jgi:hypothetical protein
MTVVEAASVIRLGSIARASAVYEAIPAFQSIESAAFPLHVGKKLWMDKSWKLVAIDAGYSLVSLAVMAAILVLWK